jgi:hypothetical protein
MRKEKAGVPRVFTEGRFGGTAGVAGCGTAEGKRYTTGASDFGMIAQALNNALAASIRQ